MKHRVAHILLTLMAIGSASPAYAATVEQVYNQAQSRQDFRRADTELTRLYKARMAELPENEKKSFKESQRKWVAGQQAVVDANPGKEVDALYQYTLDRIGLLKQNLNPTPEQAAPSKDASPSSTPTPVSTEQPPQKLDPASMDFETLKMSAEKGDPKSQYVLGQRYLRGDGVQEDKAEAVKWFEKSSNMEGVPLAESVSSSDTHKRENGWDDGPALAALGCCYAAGDGVQKDDLWAEKYLELAAGLNNPKGLYNLGIFRENGRGTFNKVDLEEAVSLYMRAAKQGYPPAECQIGGCYYEGRGVDKNWEEAVKWFRKSAEKGWPDAENNLASCLYNGKGVAEDTTEALRWYKKAAEDGCSAAQLCMGDFYADGTGVEKSEEEAVRWYKKAADQGNPQAQVALGVCYLDGKGVKADAAMAAKCYEDAANQGFAAAQYNLGLLFAGGVGVQEDLVKAKQWLTQAAANKEYYEANKEEIEKWLDKVSGARGPTSEADNSKAAAIKVKGFFIGMSEKAALENVAEKLGKSTADFMECRDDNDNPMIVISSKLNIQELALLIVNLNPAPDVAAAKNRVASSELPDAEKIKVVCKNLKLSGKLMETYEQKKDTVLSVIRSDPEHRVCYIRFNSGLSNYLFNATEMEASAFAAQFLEGYKLPKWQTVPDWESSSPQKYWSYISDDGVKITLYPHKDLVIQRVPNKEQQRSSFN